MKKIEALAVFNSRIMNGQISAGNLSQKGNIEEEICKLADEDEGFENVVFELGCSALAKAYEKSKRKQKYTI